MKTIAQLLEDKGADVYTVTSDTPVFEGLKVLAEKNIGALVVADGNHLVGIFSERDYARKVILEGKNSRETLVGEIMTAKVTCIGPDQNIQDCMALMTEQHIRHIPVLEEGKLLGVISIGDVVKAVISEQEFIIEQLENYITGTGQA